MGERAGEETGIGAVLVQRLNTPVTVVVINYNGKEHLQDCLLSVRSARGPVHEVIVVDDASTDGTADLISARFPWVRLIRLKNTLGPSVARNVGLQAANTNLVCLLDNDVVVSRNWLMRLMEGFFRCEDAALASPRILVYEDPRIIGTDGVDIHFLGMPTLRNAGKRVSEAQPNHCHETGAAGGAAILVDKSRLGATVFDPDFFYGFEDTDFCLGIRSRGLRCLFIPDAVVSHKYRDGGVPGLSDQRDSFAPRRAYHVFRNRWYIIIKYYCTRTLLVLFPALILFEFATALFSVRRGVFCVYLRTLGDLLQNRKMLLGKRRALKQVRKLEDKQLLSAHPISVGRGTLRNGMETRILKLADRFFSLYWNLAVRFL
jgi:hypothetical protein